LSKGAILEKVAKISDEIHSDRQEIPQRDKEERSVQLEAFALWKSDPFLSAPPVSAWGGAGRIEAVDIDAAPFSASFELGLRSHDFGYGQMK
jgi:hypothetical protein